MTIRRVINKLKAIFRVKEGLKSYLRGRISLEIQEIMGILGMLV